jgi:3-oxoacyl-[acyl-carrier protein] reductase
MTLGLARAGASVIATASRAVAGLEAVAAESCGHCFVTVQVDVTRPEDCTRVAQTALARCGGLDVLVNNAGRGMKYVSQHFPTEPPRF